MRNYATGITASGEHLTYEVYREGLLKWLKPGDTVYTVLRHVSRSGMSRSIDAYKMEHDGPTMLTGPACRLLGLTFDRNNGGAKMGGCGMDMGFAMIYELSYALWPTGYTCIGEHCPSSDHSNGDRDYTPHAHKDGGHALRQKWL